MARNYEPDYRPAKIWSIAATISAFIGIWPLSYLNQPHFEGDWVATALKITIVGAIVAMFFVAMSFCSLELEKAHKEDDQ